MVQLSVSEAGPDPGDINGLDLAESDEGHGKTSKISFVRYFVKYRGLILGVLTVLLYLFCGTLFHDLYSRVNPYLFVAFCINSLHADFRKLPWYEKSTLSSLCVSVWKLCNSLGSKLGKQILIRVVRRI